MQNGSSVALDMGDELTAALPENPTTGYRWQQGSSGGALELLHDDFKEGGAGAGAAGTRRLTFRAAAPGRIRLVLVKRREWEHGVPPSEEFAVTVDVGRR